jgi:hypothetical protein
MSARRSAHPPRVGACASAIAPSDATPAREIGMSRTSSTVFAFLLPVPLVKGPARPAVHAIAARAGRARYSTGSADPRPRPARRASDRVHDVEQPAALRVGLRRHQLDRLGNPFVRREPGPAEVVEGSQHVVVPPPGEGELRPVATALPIARDYLAGRAAPQEASCEQVLLAAELCDGQRRRRPACSLVLGQRLEHTERRVERRAGRVGRRLAVPTTVTELLAEQAVHDTADVLPEVRAYRRDLRIDARLDLAGEERIVVALGRTAATPCHPIAHATNRTTCLDTRGVESHVIEQREDVHRGIPATVPRRAAPAAVRRLEREQARAYSLACDLRPLGSDRLGRRVGQVGHHLPANRRIRVEQPFDDGHERPSGAGCERWAAHTHPTTRLPWWSVRLDGMQIRPRRASRRDTSRGGPPSSVRAPAPRMLRTARRLHRTENARIARAIGGGRSFDAG